LLTSEKQPTQNICDGCRAGPSFPLKGKEKKKKAKLQNPSERMGFPYPLD
jgi:hypothetical protein